MREWLVSDALAVGLILLAGFAWLTGQVMTPGSLLAIGCGALVVSIVWRICVWALNRRDRGDWPFDPDRKLGAGPRRT